MGRQPRRWKGGMLVLVSSLCLACGKADGGRDSGTDAGETMLAEEDAGVADAGVADAGRADAGARTDAGVADAGTSQDSGAPAVFQPGFHQALRQTVMTAGRTT